MNTITISQKEKNKHLELHHYEFIVNELNKFNYLEKKNRRGCGKTDFIRNLAETVGTTVSNLYKIIEAATINAVDTNLIEHPELSALAAYNIRSKNHKIPNNSKLEKARDFIDLVVSEVKSNEMSSIDETVNWLIRYEQERIEGMETVSTKTIYNYVHEGNIDLKPIDLPRMLRRKPSRNYKEYIPRSQKGTSITERPEEVESREEFGHWEGDLVCGPRDGQNGAYLTLVERKTRFLYIMQIKKKSAKQVYMQINRLNRFYGDDFSSIFKSITFDNGNEFSRYGDIEKKPGTGRKRTTVYFGRPYHSSDRASNENCNGLIRYFVKKGTVINTIPKEKTLEINTKINRKRRKILDYLSSEIVFLNELSEINVAENTIFYEN